MNNVLHMIWLGGVPALHTLQNLRRIAGLYARQLLADGHRPAIDQPYLPLLWLDRQAQRALLADAAIPFTPAATDSVPPLWQARAADALGDLLPHCQWLRLPAPDGDLHLPCLLHEDLLAELAAPWRDCHDVAATLINLQRHRPAAGTALAGKFGETSPEHWAAGIDGVAISQYWAELIEHVKTHWAKQGLLCLASDLLRLQALVRLPGAYIDVGDVAGRISVLPTSRRVRADLADFCGHQTVAIENDIIFCQSPALLKSIAYGSFLWSWRTLRGTARRLGLQDSGGAPADLLRRVLPHLDARLPRLPDLRPLLRPPYLPLANLISLAYRGPIMFPEAAGFEAFVGKQRYKEALINDLGGFTGYQHFAAQLAPTSAQAWAACAADFGLAGYAPQLGWHTHGFGLLENLIHCGRLILDGNEATAAQAELARLSASLDINTRQLAHTAHFCAEAYEHLKTATLAPEHKAASLQAVRQLATALAAQQAVLAGSEAGGNGSPAS